MAYKGEPSINEQVFIDTQGQQTIVDYIFSESNHTQRTTISFTTGAWVRLPSLFQTAIGLVAQIELYQGSWFVINIGKSDVNVSTVEPSLAGAKVIPLEQASMPPLNPQSPNPPPQPPTPPILPLPPQPPT